MASILHQDSIEDGLGPLPPKGHVVMTPAEWNEFNTTMFYRHLALAQIGLNDGNLDFARENVIRANEKFSALPYHSAGDYSVLHDVQLAVAHEQVHRYQEMYRN